MTGLSRRIKIGLILALIVLIVLAFSIFGCAIDLRGRATAFDARIDDTAQTSLTSGRPARD